MSRCWRAVHSLTFLAALALVFPFPGIGAAPAENARVELVATIESPKSGFFRKLLTGADPEVLVRPYGITWDGDDVIVADPGAGHVVKLARGKATVSKALSSEPIGVAVCEGRVFVTDSRHGTVEELDKLLAHKRWVARDLERPTGIACWHAGLAVAETGAHRIALIAPDGTKQTVGARGAAPGQFNFPASIATTGTTLVIADTMNFRIQIFTGAVPAYSSMFGGLGDTSGDLPRTKGIALDSRGNIWLADAHLDELAVFNAEGDYLMSIGEPGADPGQFSFPAGLAFNAKGQLAVVDSLNRRIQVYDVDTGDAR